MVGIGGGFLNLSNQYIGRKADATTGVEALKNSDSIELPKIITVKKGASGFLIHPGWNSDDVDDVTASFDGTKFSLNAPWSNPIKVKLDGVDIGTAGLNSPLSHTLSAEKDSVSVTIYR